ncbi:MAG: lytic transglycosylase domain-containing protein [Bosea sp. (in: a-proteobacteria)]
MTHCHLKLVVMLLPLWPAGPTLAQSTGVPDQGTPAAASPDLVINEQGAVIRQSPTSSTGKHVDRVLQGSIMFAPTDVQMAFAPSAPGGNGLSPAQPQPCPSTPTLSPSDALALVRRVAEQERFYPDFVLAVARQESQFKVDALSEKGAYGLMQLMPATATQYDVDRCIPEANVRGGIRFLRELHQRYRNPLYVLAAYNAGETALREHGGIPPFPETVAYVAAVLNDFYGYPGIKGAAGPASATGAAPSRVSASTSAATRRSARPASSSASTVTAKPSDWLVLHVE